MLSLTYVEIDVPSWVEQSPVVFDTLRFAIPADYLPMDIDCIPSINSVSFTPALVSLGKDLGQRAKIVVNFADHRHIFNGEPYGQGTFWGKWRGRYGTTLRGCRLRVIRGQVGQSLAEMDTRHYVIDASAGPDPNSGVFVIEAKDVLKFADEDRAQAPALSNGRLAGSLTSGATAATLAPAGIGNAEYPASGYLCLGGKEVVSFTRSADSLTITRGQLGSVAQAHDSGDRAQLVLRYDGDNPAVIIEELLTQYAGVDPGYIDLPTWESEVNSNLGVLYARTITEPTSVNKLVSELIEQAALALWWDDRALQLRLAVLREIATDTASFDEEKIIQRSMRVQEQPGERISRIQTYYGTRDPTDRGAEEDNFRAALETLELAKELEYGSAEIRRVLGTWIETETAAQRLNAIQISRFQDPPRNFRFALIAGEPVSLVQGYSLSWWGSQDETGLPVPVKIQVTQVSIFADRVEVEAEEMLASGELPALVNVVFLTTTGSLLSWTVPASWNDADNSIHSIGGGAGGGASGSDGGRGGGGGAYSRKENLDLTPGASVSYRVGAGGIGGADDQPPNTATGTDGGDTWFNGATLGASSCGAKGGQGGSGRTGGGLGGAAASGVGDFKTSGGAGGLGASKGDTRAGGGGGGGAGGPNGDGGMGGGNGGGGMDAGGGGGGADGGFTGAVGGGSAGGAGGNNRYDFGGGNDTTPVGDEGGGGRGGDRGQDGYAGGAGEQIWTQTVNPIISAGPGGGAGGSGDGARGGRGGAYGGGGGGNGSDGSAAGDGEQGIIVIMWREP